VILLIAGTASGGHYLPAFNMGYSLRYFHGRDTLLAVFGSGKYSEENSGWIINFTSLREFSRFLKERKDDIEAVISFGSRHVILPSILAKRITGTLWVHEQNVIPGKANKLLFHFADKILLTFEGAEPFIPPSFYRKLVVVGYPLMEIEEENTPLPYDVLQMTKDKKVVVFTGGSKGSVEIGVIASNFLKHVIENNIKDVFVIWQRGREDVWFQSQHGFVRGFIPKLYKVFEIADLVIARGGAGTIAELVSLGKKAILVPLRGLASDHQYFNALYSGYPIGRIDTLTFDTIYGALHDEKKFSETKIKIMDYEFVIDLIGGRE